MVALPIVNSKKASNISPLFGKAKYFALYEGNKIEVVKNEVLNGKRIIQWLKDLGVDQLIVNHLGKRPFEMILSSGMKAYFCEKKTASNDAVLKFLNGELQEITKENFEELVAEEEKKEFSFSTSAKKCCHNKKDNIVSTMGHSHCH